MYFEYGETEISYLRQKDKRLCAVIDSIGHIDRAVDADLFSSIVHHIIGQQISTKAQAIIWQRLQDTFGEVNAETIRTVGVPKLQSMGMTFRKSVACLYLWAVAGGAIPEMKNHRPENGGK